MEMLLQQSEQSLGQTDQQIQQLGPLLTELARLEGAAIRVKIGMVVDGEALVVARVGPW
jgi:hypothetical protein